ncbi:Hypothetical predicted protein [Cloeon dipterum]|uniref:Major facilitator superfamily (MFS) profile domain-containing protein n=1 Tax=Cloeon dipterum TaxID=197152 RepID=A0A8S1CIT4_9INSE|nr:Hypothetical predicted protein [Cloeon dipterum]
MVKPAKKRNEVLDELLAELGSFGKFQARNYALICCAVLFCAAYTVTYIFSAGIVHHRCLVPECGESVGNATYDTPWLHDAVPLDKETKVPSFCRAYDSIENATDQCSFDSELTHECSEFVFKGPQITIQQEFNLTCHRNSWKLAFVGSLNNVGRLVGLPVHGYISDRFGRRTSLIVTMVGSGIFGIVRTFAWNYESFLTFEFLEAFFSGGIYAVAFILAMEMVGPGKRVMGGAMLVWSFALGQVFLGLMAWWLPNWRTMTLAIYTPSLLFIFYFWLIPESLRWSMSNGKYSVVRRVLEKAASSNKVKFSEPLLAEMNTWVDGQKEVDNNGADDDKPLSFIAAMKEVFTSKVMVLRLLNCYLCWVTNTLVYYGLSLNSVSLAGTDNEYINFILVSVVEAPSYIFAWYGMSRFGRRKSLCTALLLSGSCSFGSYFIPKDSNVLRVILYMTGKFAITAAFDSLYVFTAEIFPTKLRTSLLSSCSMVGRLGSIMAPQTPLLAEISPLLPLGIFGAFALTSGVLTLFLPETLGKSLPDSIEESKNIGNENGNPNCNGTNKAVPTIILSRVEDETNKSS